MTSRTASGTKLLDGLEEHHCKVGVLLASQQDAPTACLMAERPSRKFHRCLSPGAPGRGAARKLLFVHGVRFAALLGIGGGSMISSA